VRALFSDLGKIYAGLCLHENMLEITPLAHLKEVQDFLKKGLRDEDKFKDSSEGENAGDKGGEGGEGGRKDNRDRKDKGDRNDKGDGKDKGGRGGGGGKRAKQGEHNSGGTNSKHQKTQQHIHPLFKTNFDLDFVLEQATSFPVKDQLDYLLQVCEPYLAEI
jgi:hypothetical protein